MISSFRISKLIKEKLDSKDIDDNLKSMIWQLLSFENENLDGKYSYEYQRCLDIYLKKVDKK